jgi:hypothetical protein
MSNSACLMATRDPRNLWAPPIVVVLEDAPGAVECPGGAAYR